MQIIFTIDRFEGEQAVLIGSDGQSLVWPKNKLPENLREGAALSFEITEKKERENRDKQTAKDIINEIINQP
jgi:hypothetical protein